MPPFDPEGGLALILLRAAAVASLLSAFGTLVFGVAVAPRAFTGAPAEVSRPAWRALTRLCRVSLLAAVLFALAWLVAESGQLAGASGLAATLSAVPTVLSGTVFGQALALRLIALVIVIAVLGRQPSVLRWWAATVLCGAALCLHAAHSHAMAMVHGPSVLLVAQALHLLAAGGWLGGLLPLLLVVHLTPPRTGAAACRWFSPLGKCCIAGIVLSAAWQFCVLIGGPVGMIGTAHGWTDAAKTFLLMVLLGFAALNRYRLAPALRGADPPVARRVLLRSLALQTTAGLVIVGVAALLASLPPAMHTQPLWPFAWRPSLVALEDPDLRREIAVATVVTLAGIAVAAAGLIFRFYRWLLIAAGVASAVLAGRSFNLLLVEAYPTSFYRSPSGFSAQSITIGAGLYPTHCASCHGAHGQGDGRDGVGLGVPPADLTAAHLWDHSDGELFWWLSHGMDSPDGGQVMPGFADRLTEDERWALIDAIRANNAGMSLGGGRAWARPTQAPRFEAACGDGETFDLADPKGRVARIVIAGGGESLASQTGPAGPDPHVLTIIIGPTSAATEAGVCTADDPAVLAAYGLVAGVQPDALAGTQFLVDPQGWLRRLWRPGDSPGWTRLPGTGFRGRGYLQGSAGGAGEGSPSLRRKARALPWTRQGAVAPWTPLLK